MREAGSRLAVGPVLALRRRLSFLQATNTAIYSALGHGVCREKAKLGLRESASPSPARGMLYAARHVCKEPACVEKLHGRHLACGHLTGNAGREVDILF